MSLNKVFFLILMDKVRIIGKGCQNDKLTRSSIIQSIKQNFLRIFVSWQASVDRQTVRTSFSVSSQICEGRRTRFDQDSAPLPFSFEVVSSAFGTSCFDEKSVPFLVKVSVDRVRLLETTESSLHWKLKLFHFMFF
jgi:hypothetical protein